MNLQRKDRREQGPRKRRGKIVVMAAFLLIFMMGMVAFGVDVGYMALTKTELQCSTDAAALAGAGELVNGTAAAQTAALSFLGSNKAGGHTLTSSNATFQFGNWNNTTHVFTQGGDTPNDLHQPAAAVFWARAGPQHF